MKIRIPDAALLDDEEHASAVYALKEFLREGPYDTDFGLCWHISQAMPRGHELFVYDVGYEIVGKFFGALTGYMSFPFEEHPTPHNYHQRIRWAEIILTAYEGQQTIILDKEDVAALRDGYLHPHLIEEV